MILTKSYMISVLHRFNIMLMSWVYSMGWDSDDLPINARKREEVRLTLFSVFFWFDHTPKSCVEYFASRLV